MIEVFGRYAGFTALLPTMAGAADRCVIPEHAVDIEHLTELLVYDRNRQPQPLRRGPRLGGRAPHDQEGMSFESEETDMFGHRKLGGIGDKVAAALKEYSPQVQQRPPHRRRQPAARLPRSLGRSRRARLDRADGVRQSRARPRCSKKQSGRLVSIHKGFYDSVPITSVTSEKKVVDVEKYYNTDRLRPIYEFEGRRCSS